MWRDYRAPALVLAVVRGADAVVLRFGVTTKGSGVEPDGCTLLRIGSIAKAFACHLLASLAADGRARLPDLGCEVPARPEAAGNRRGGKPIMRVQSNDSWQYFRF
jgi:D-alanyl-D-alanine-carboxypeptidase/D-alanyl-D-alanine-endopeptidase